MIIFKNNVLMKMMEKCKKLIFFQKDLRHQTMLENASEKSQTCPRVPYALFYSYVYINVCSGINDVLHRYSNIEHE